MTILRWGSHTARLDALHGLGLLVCPPDRDDVADPFPAGASALTLFQGEYDRAMRELYELGSEPTLDEFDDEPMVIGRTAAGGEVIALVSLSPIGGHPDLETENAAMLELLALEGVSYNF